MAALCPCRGPKSSFASDCRYHDFTCDTFLPPHATRGSQMAGFTMCAPEMCKGLVSR